MTLTRREKSILLLTRQRGGACVSDTSAVVRRPLVAGLIYRDDDWMFWTQELGHFVAGGRYRATEAGRAARNEIGKEST